MWLVVSSIPHYHIVSTFNCLQFVLKTECLCFFVENWMQKYSQEGFFPTYVQPKHQSDEHTKNGASDFQHLIWLFWVCQISLSWYNIDYFQCFDLITINFNWCAWVGSIIQQEISSMKLHKPLLTHSVNHFSIHFSIPSPYTAQIFFLHFCCIFTLLEIIQHNMLLFSSIFNIKMATQKFTNFDKFF